MFYGECSDCDCSPCVCSHDNLSTYIVGRDSHEFVGIKNVDRENNCFVSTGLQALLNTTPFSQMLNEECEDNELCIICCLKRLHDELEDSKSKKNSVIDFREYRLLLARICRNECFGMGIEGDCFEAVEAILTNAHYASKGIFMIEQNGMGASEVCDGDCHAHFVCYNLLEEARECRCNSEKTSNLTNSFVIRIDSNSFIKTVSQTLIYDFGRQYNNELHTMYDRSEMKNLIGSFTKILREHFGQGKVFDEVCQFCNSNFLRSVKLLSSPKIMIFQIMWPFAAEPNLLNILQVMVSLQGKIKMNEIFSGDSDIEMGLKGMIVFLNNHYVYFGIGEDFRWYRVDDSLCQTIGVGRWYDVLLLLLLMKGTPVGLIYEECHVADLSLYKIELLYLEKIVCNCSNNASGDAGALENSPKISINPVKHLCSENTGEIECVNCNAKKRVGLKCDLCGFNPNEGNWMCKSCRRRNDEMVLMCDYCDDIRFRTPCELDRCTCGQAKFSRFCIKCNIIAECNNCKKPINVVQSSFCALCKSNCRDGHCESCKNEKMLCKSCSTN
ncbi:hypothetical protein SteCoe_4270 [Stentor coeruleus]|uniref:USP domain-containing protein n=1 Tax=Stentor coeruleus TaxID=5963 RepID=A0A1R2CV79_9CILI|nr:hypothetical protein SteCoe_4270 [Stentor coeruleus]